MTPRERNMAIGFIALIVFGGGAFGGYTFVVSPLQDVWAAKEKLQQELDGTADKPGLEGRVEAMRKAMPRVVAAKRQSLPPDVDQAKKLYTDEIERLLRQAKIIDFKTQEPKLLDTRPPVTPEVSAKNPAYRRLSFHLEMSKVNIWQVADFLQAFYNLDLLHQITEISITRQNKVTETRSGLQVQMTIEAIILDVAEKRKALFPMAPDNKLTLNGEVVAAVGGVRAAMAVAARPETAQKFVARAERSVLSTKHRNYSYLALRDIFYGALNPSKIMQGVYVSDLKDIQLRIGQKIPPVKVTIKGEAADEAKVAAEAWIKDSKGERNTVPLEIDQNTRTILFPEPKDLIERGTALITVTASSPDGRKDSKKFRVSYAGDDIATAIRLVSVWESDGTYSAQIFDIATPHKYSVTFNSKTGVEIAKMRMKLRGKEWEEDPEHRYGAGIIAISDDNSSTRKYLRVVGMQDDSMIVQILEQEPKPEGKGGRPGAGGGKGPGGGGFGGGKGPGGIGGKGPGAAKDGAKDAPPVVAAKPPPPDPTLPLYRWTVGKTLQDLGEAKIPAAEASKIMKQLAQAAMPEVPVAVQK